MVNLHRDRAPQPHKPLRRLPNMDPEQLKAFTDAIEALRADIAASISAVDAKCDALADKMKKADGDDNGEMSERTAADSVATRGDIEVLQAQLRSLQMAQPTRRPADSN